MPAKIDRAKIVSHVAGRGSAINRVSKTQLAFSILSPTFHSPLIGKSTAVTISQLQINRRETTSQINGG